MSRSGYSDDCENLELYRNAVERALNGKRGQTLLRELLEALDAMPDKRLYRGSFATGAGEFCTLGVLGAKRGTKMDDLGDEDYCEPGVVGQRFGIARSMAAEIMYENDEEYSDDWTYVDVVVCGPIRRWESHERRMRVPALDGPERRWRRMRKWVSDQLASESPGVGDGKA